MITVFVEGGLVQAVVDTAKRNPQKGVPYEVVDYDVCRVEGPAEVKEYFESLDVSVIKYMKKYLPAEYARFVKASQRSK